MTTGGFPHSDIHGSTLVGSSPWLFAAFYVLHRFLAPRHPPLALHSLEFLDARVRYRNVKEQTQPENRPARKQQTPAPNQQDERPQLPQNETEDPDTPTPAGRSQPTTTTTNQSKHIKLAINQESTLPNERSV